MNEQEYEQSIARANQGVVCHGHILNLSSIGCIVGGFPGWGIYCTTKFAVEGLSEVLAAEVGPFGIKVTTLVANVFVNEEIKARKGIYGHNQTKKPRRHFGKLPYCV